MSAKLVHGSYLVREMTHSSSSKRLSAPFATAQSNGAVEEMFDGIEYGKGAAIIAQAIMAFGTVEFDNGVAAYIKKHAFGNTKANDFWSALAEAANDAAVEKMAGWWALFVGTFFPLLFSLLILLLLLAVATAPPTPPFTNVDPLIHSLI